MFSSPVHSVERGLLMMVPISGCNGTFDGRWRLVIDRCTSFSNLDKDLDGDRSGNVKDAILRTVGKGM